MMSSMKWVSSVAAIVLLAGSAMSADHIAEGKVKGVDADKKEFTVTDTAGRLQCEFIAINGLP